MAQHICLQHSNLDHSGERLQLDLLMDTFGSDEQALEDEAGISTESGPMSTESADLVPEHIIEGKRVRRHTD
jgi:hypothetical protein